MSFLFTASGLYFTSKHFNDTIQTEVSIWFLLRIKHTFFYASLFSQFASWERGSSTACVLLGKPGNAATVKTQGDENALLSASIIVTINTCSRHHNFAWQNNLAFTTFNRPWCESFTAAVLFLFIYSVNCKAKSCGKNYIVIYSANISSRCRSIIMRNCFLHNLFIRNIAM